MKPGMKPIGEEGDGTAWEAEKGFEPVAMQPGFVMKGGTVPKGDPRP